MNNVGTMREIVEYTTNSTVLITLKKEPYPMHKQVVWVACHIIFELPNANEMAKRIQKYASEWFPIERGESLSIQVSGYGKLCVSLKKRYFHISKQNLLDLWQHTISLCEKISEQEGV